MRTFAFVAAAFATAAFTAPALAEDAFEIPSGAWTLDKGHAHVYFEISHLGFSMTQGRFNDFDAALALDPEDPSKSTLDVTIDAASIDMNHEEFDGHLKGEQWFNVEEFPTLSFKATTIAQTSVDTATVTGDFTMLGVTKPVILDVKLNQAANNFQGVPTVGFSATGTLDRTEWGMEAFKGAVGNDVHLRIEAEFNKPAE